MLTAQIAIAQIVPQFHSQMTSETAVLTLPDAPEAVSSSVDPGGTSSAFAEAAFDPASRPVRQKAMASPTTKYIAPGQQVPSLSIGNKTLLGIKDAVSPFSMAGWILSAGYSHVTNGSPNYGTNSDAFGQRFGASVARDISEGVFSDSIMASVLREDPRYYKMGPGHSFIRRVVYAGTRPLIGRTDGGRTTPNFALLTGTLGGAVLTDAYYPQINRGFTQTAETFGTSIGGDALGFVVSEFLSETLQIVHLKKAD
ncbi:MAG: hypothetical protein ABI380_11005 [Edaphobacter sp.]